MRYVSIILLSLIPTGLYSTEPIDRYALVSRHNVHIREADTLNSLTVGNGEFAFTADVTGLQTFPEYYKNGVSLGTMSQWGWHSFPNIDNYKLSEVLQDYEFHGRKVSYSVERSDTKHQVAATDFLRRNAHRLHLGIIGLEMITSGGSPAGPADIKDIDQVLDLWTGEITSRFTFMGEPVEVLTVCHQDKDLVSCRIRSELVKSGKIKVRFRFPYVTAAHTDWACDFNSPGKHTSAIADKTNTSVQIQRVLDSTEYYTTVSWKGKAEFKNPGQHEFLLSSGSNTLEFNVYFTRNKGTVKLPSFKDTKLNSADAWKNYWTKGGAVDFSGSTDPRAAELERRIVLSRYLTRIQCAGSFPPQETGLTFNSWYGKFHLEMHWWHAAHFAQWNQPELLEKSLSWYGSIIDKARITAQRQGFDGIRWPKQVDTTGNETPSRTGQLLIWQQPHIIYFAEQLYRVNRNMNIILKYKDLVFATADFMASYAWYDKEKDKYILGPAMIAAQETVNKTDIIINTPYELAYWHWGLETAQKWLVRLGLKRNALWDEVISKLPPLPKDEGLYLVAENATDSYTNQRYISDHPAVFGAYGVLPASRLVDPAVMSATFDKIMKVWNWSSTWGWDYPMAAMTAVRLNEPEKAIDALMLGVQKNTYLRNGHNYQDNRLRIYLPGNGGLLAAVALMCAGYDGCTVENPGIPKDGKWKVRWEGLTKLP